MSSQRGSKQQVVLPSLTSLHSIWHKNEPPSSFPVFAPDVTLVTMVTGSLSEEFVTHVIHEQ